MRCVSSGNTMATLPQCHHVNRATPHLTVAARVYIHGLWILEYILFLAMRYEIKGAALRSFELVLFGSGLCIDSFEVLWSCSAVLFSILDIFYILTAVPSCHLC